MLESREIDPPAGIVPLQIARIGQAMIVMHTVTIEGNLQAVDRMISTASRRPEFLRRRSRRRGGRR